MEEEPRVEVRKTFWKFEWDSKTPGEESWYLQSEEREVSRHWLHAHHPWGQGPWQDLHGREVLSALRPCRRQDWRQRDGNQPHSSRALLRKVAFPAKVCLGPLANLNFHVYLH